MPYKPLSKTVDRIRKGDVLQATHSKRGWEALFVVDRITRAGIVHATLCRYQRETAPPNGLLPHKVRFTREGDRLFEVMSLDDFMALGCWIEDSD